MLFTIGIPAYKVSYLRECIDSVLSQNLTDFELIIVNDDSPFNVEEVINSYQSPLIWYYRNEENCGAVNVVDNWNKCLEYANGEYFILMGDDDVMCPDYLTGFEVLIRKYPDVGVLHCRSYIIDADSRVMELTEPRPEYENVYDSILQRMTGNRLFFISDYVFKTDDLKEMGGFYKLPLAWASDDISAYKAAYKHGIAHTNTPLFKYRRNTETISSTGNVYEKMEAILQEDRWFDEFLSIGARTDDEQIIKSSILREKTKFIQKKKIRTIYSSDYTNLFSLFIKWYRLRHKYKLSLNELIYTIILAVKESKKEDMLRKHHQ